MPPLMLIVRMAGETVALDAAGVEAVIEFGAVTPIPLAPAHIVGLAPARSRVLTIVDVRPVLGLETVKPSGVQSAVIVPVDDHPYGILLDDVIDVVTADGPMAGDCGPDAEGWARIAAGSVTIARRVHIVVDAARLVGGGALAAH